MSLFVSNIIQYEISFLIQILKFRIFNVKVFYIQIWFKCETLLLFFLIRTMVYWKKTFYRQNIELRIIHTWRLCNLSRWNSGCNYIWKRSVKAKTCWKCLKKIVVLNKFYMLYLQSLCVLISMQNMAGAFL